ncbi:MAG: redoxin family protein [Nitrospirota bacterium]|nr:redoxin family protein [Nitrospirota bacterium]
MNNTNQNQAPRPSLTICLFLLIGPMFTLLGAPAVFGKALSLEKGQPIPAVTLIGKDGESVSLDTLKGQVTLVSIVPQLNTPVCDEQTHRFSEQNEGLDEFIALVTMSTNTNTDQANFAKEAKIHNMTFLSDAPDFHFGKKTGLLLDDVDILHRAVIVLDEDSIIRYVELVPMSQLPNFEQAYRAVRGILPKSS